MQTTRNKISVLKVAIKADTDKNFKPKRLSMVLEVYLSYITIEVILGGTKLQLPGNSDTCIAPFKDTLSPT